MDLQSAIDLFQSEQIPTTRRSYKRILREMQDHIGPARPLDHVSVEDVLLFMGIIRERDYAPATVLKYIKTVKLFFNWGVRMHLIETSPAAGLKAARPRDSRIPRDKAMPDADLARLLDYVKWKPRDHALVLFIADTGCRAGGAAGLREQDLDLDAQTATVTEKGDKSRRVAFGDRCAHALRTWLIRRPANAGAYVFSSDGHRLKSGSISTILKRACNHAGLRAYGPHSLRHRKGHQLADAKVAPTIAAEVLGHSDPTITLQHYYPNDWDRVEQAMRGLTVDSDQPQKIIRFRGHSG